MNMHRWLLTFALATLLLAPAGAPAGQIYEVSLNTAPLEGNTAGPFSLDFQFIGTGNNTVTLSNFQFGGGAADTFGTGLFDNLYSSGSFSGSASSSVTLTDTANFYNEFTQQFTPGSSLSFQVSLTTNVALPTPDQFSFGILDSAGNDIPMLNSPTGSFLVVTLNSSTSPQVQTFANDPTVPDAASGGVIASTGPVQAPGANPVPEPASLVLLAMGMTALCGWKLRARRQRERSASPCPLSGLVQK
jgi:PEP-CTERM motif